MLRQKSYRNEGLYLIYASKKKMPFKDVDLKALNRANEISQQLGNKVAVIDKLNSSLSADKKLAAVELLTGKKVQPKRDRIQETVKEQETSKSLGPVLKEIDNLIHTVQDETEAFANQQPALPAIAAPPAASVGVVPIDGGQQQGINLYERYGFTGDDLSFYAHNQLKDLNVVAQENDQAYIKSTIRELAGLSQTLGGQKSGLRRRPNQTNRDRDRLAIIEKELASVKKYREVLKKMSMVGTGIVKICQYAIPAKRLKRDNILSVRYGKSNKMVPRFGAAKVSDNVKQVIANKNVKADVKLSSGERQFLDSLYHAGGEMLSPSKSKLLRGSSVFTSFKEIIKKVELLLGEISAGNTSIALRNELTDLLHYLYQHKKIRKGMYTSLITAINKNE